MESFEGTHLVFVGAGSDPFEVITNSVKYVNAISDKHHCFDPLFCVFHFLYVSNSIC